MSTIRNALICGCLAFVFAACGATTPTRENAAKPPSATARAQNTTNTAVTKPDFILMIHGLDISQTNENTFEPNPVPGVDCNDVWNPLINTFDAQGYNRSQILTVGYYKNDLNCSINLSDLYHSEVFPGSFSAPGDEDDTATMFPLDLNNPTDLTNDAPIALVGWRLARYIYSNFTSRGKSVAIVTHSLGGPIARYAIGGAARGMFADWGVSALNISALLTFAAPHAGSNYAYWVELMRVFIPEFSPTTGMRRGDQCGRQCRDLLPGSYVLQAINNAIDTNSADVGRRLTVASVAFGDEDGLVSTSSAHAAPGDHMTYTNPGYAHMRNDLRTQGVGQLKDDGSLAHDAVFTTTDASLIDPGSRPGCAAAQFVFGGCSLPYGFTVNTIGFPDQTGQNIAIVGRTCGVSGEVRGLDIAGFIEIPSGWSYTSPTLSIDGQLLSSAVSDSGLRADGNQYVVLTAGAPYDTGEGSHTLKIDLLVTTPATGGAARSFSKEASFTAVAKTDCAPSDPNPVIGTPGNPSSPPTDPTDPGNPPMSPPVNPGDPSAAKLYCEVVVSGTVLSSYGEYVPFNDTIRFETDEYQPGGFTYSPWGNYQGKDYFLGKLSHPRSTVVANIGSYNVGGDNIWTSGGGVLPDMSITNHTCAETRPATW